MTAATNPDGLTPNQPEVAPGSTLPPDEIDRLTLAFREMAARIEDQRLRTFDPVRSSPLTFEAVDHELFPLFELGVTAGRTGGTAPAAFNAANEIAVEAFLKERIRFPGMRAVVEAALAEHRPIPVREVADVLDPELSVAVDERDELVLGRREAGAERGAVAEVGRMVDGANDPGVGGGELVGQDPRPVPRAVVHRDDLEGFRERRQRIERFGDQPLDVRLLVVGWEEERQARDMRGRWHQLAQRRGHAPAPRWRMTRASMLGSNPPIGSVTYRWAMPAMSSGSTRITYTGRWGRLLSITS